MKKAFSKSLLSVLSVATLAALASCGGSKINPYDLDFTVETKGTSISFWTPFGSDIQDFVQDICERFEVKTGIHVDTESKGSYDGLQKAVSLAASHRTYPHVTLAYPDHMASYVNADIILRLDYYLENDGDDTFTLSDFYQDYLVENQEVEFKEDGTGYTLGLPFNKSTEVMCYNKTFFEWAGSVEPEITVPSTWEEMYEVGPKIRGFLAPYFGKIVGTDFNTYASTMDFPEDGSVTTLFDYRTVNDGNFYPFTYDSQANMFITAVRQWGGTYTVVDKATKKGYIAFDSAETIAALTELQKAYNDRVLAIPDTYGGTTKYNSAYFTNNQSVMTVGSSAGVKNSVSQSFETGIAPLLYKDASRKYVISQGTNAVLLDQGTPAERVAAWKFVKYLTKEINGYFASKTSYFPSGAPATESKDYQDKVAETKDSKAGNDIVWYGANKVNDDYYLNDDEQWVKFTDPAFIGSSTVREAMGTSMAQLFIDKKSPRKLIDDLKSTLKDYVR